MLDREVSVEQKSVTVDAYGTDVVAWIPLSPLPGSPVAAERFYAEVQDALPSRSEALAQGLRVTRKLTRVRMRWRNDITSAMRITVHGDTDTVYQIVSEPAEVGGRKNLIEVMCERVTSDS